MKRIFWAIILAITVTGCGSNVPPKEEAKRRMLSELPPYFSFEKGEVETTAAGQGEFACNVSLVITPKEDLFVKTTAPQTAIELMGEVHDKEEKGEIDKKLSSTMQAAISNFLQNQSFLALKAEAGKPITIYGRVAATQLGKGWEWGSPDIEKVDMMDAKPRSTFPVTAILVNSGEAAKAMDDLRKRVDHFQIEEQQRVESAKAKLKEKQKLFLDNIKAEVIYKGSAQNNRGSEPIELIITSCDTGDFTIKARVRSSSDNTKTRDFSGTFDIEAIEDTRKPALVLVGEQSDPELKSRKHQWGPDYTLFIEDKNPTLRLFITSEGFRGESDGFARPEIKLIKKQ